jgi:Cu(I)/Ag(I) efflux system membrane fusion protein
MDTSKQSRAERVEPTQTAVEQLPVVSGGPLPTTVVSTKTKNRKLLVVLSIAVIVVISAVYVVYSDYKSTNKVTSTVSHEEHEQKAEPGWSQQDLVKANVTSFRVKTEALSYGDIFTGKLAIPDQNQRIISSRVAGRVDRLFVNRTGQEVRAGQPLYSIYSPDLNIVIDEYQLGVEQGFSEAALKAIRVRLRNLGLSDDQIEKKDGDEHLTIYSPFSGVVTAKAIREGAYVSVGTELYQLADLSTLWALVDVAEDAVHLMRIGDRIDLRTIGSVRTQFSGRVDQIFPRVDPASRTVQVRVVVKAQAGLLPETFVEAEILRTTAPVLVVPVSAVSRTGQRDYIWMKHGGSFMRHEVTLGRYASEQYYSVESGISEGDTVAGSGNFLIDADRQFSTGGGAVHNH